jgi:membrane associated rhomboid family serine protease
MGTREYFSNSRKRVIFGQDGNALTQLIIINAVVFMVISFTRVVYVVSAIDYSVFQKEVLQWIALPSDPKSLIYRPWTIFTYMFVHESPWHILSNMLWLWAFGYILQDLTGNRKIIPIFIYGGLFGGAFYFMFSQLIPHLGFGGSLVGASAGVMGVAVATTLLAPDYRIFPFINGGIPIWVLTLLYVIIDFASIPFGNPGGHIAHLGGALGGFCFVFALRKGYDWSNWMNNFFDWLGNLFSPNKKKKQNPLKQELFYDTKGKQPYHKITGVTQQRIDDILDKINQKGYKFLSDEEKDILKRASEEEL